MSVRLVRLVLTGLGVLLGAYGALLLLQQGLANLVATVIWLAGGIVVHDFVWAPVVVLGAAGGARLVPPPARPLLTAAAVVILTVTVAAIPVLGRFGARTDNPTLLDRDYLAGWLLFVAAVAAGTLVVAVVRGIHAPIDPDAGPR